MSARISFCTVGNRASPARKRSLPSFRRRSASSALTAGTPGVVEAIVLPSRGRDPCVRVTARSALDGAPLRAGAAGLRPDGREEDGDGAGPGRVRRRRGGRRLLPRADVVRGGQRRVDPPPPAERLAVPPLRQLELQRLP